MESKGTQPEYANKHGEISNLRKIRLDETKKETVWNNFMIEYVHLLLKLVKF